MLQDKASGFLIRSFSQVRNLAAGLWFPEEWCFEGGFIVMNKIIICSFLDLREI